MSGGLKVGDLYVLLSAKTSAFGKGMEDAAKLTEKVARKIKKAATEIGHLGALMGAGIAAAMAIATQHSAAVANEVGRAKDVFATVANEIATMMLPALRQMNEHLRQLLGWWQALSPETKAHIAHWVEIATVVGIAAIVIGKVAGLVAALAPAFGALGAVIGLGLSPLLGIAAALLVVIVGLAVLHKHWATVWGAIQKIMHVVLEAIGPLWSAFADFVGDIWSSMVDNAALAAKAILAIWLGVMQATGKMDEGTARLISYGTNAAINVMASTAKTPSGLKALILPGIEALKGGALDIVEEWKQIFGEAADWVKAKIGFTGQEGQTINAAAATHVTNAQRLGEAGEQGLMAEFYKNAKVEDLVRSNQFGEVSRLGDEGEQGHMTAALAQQYENEIKVREFWNGQLQSLGGALAAGARQFVSKLGAFGEVVNAGVQGFQSGGVWGAFLAVLIELLSKFKRFQEIVDIGNGMVQAALQDFGAAFDDLIDGIKPLLGAVEMILHVVHEILAPIISFIGKLLGSLAPVFALISVVLEPLAGSLQTLFDMIGQTLGPAFDILNGVATGLALVFMGLNEAALWVKAGLLEFVRWLDHTFNPTGNHSGADQAAADAWTALHKNEQQMKDIAEHGLGGLASKSAATAEALGKLGDTADQVSRQLTNIPSGFNTVLAEWRASFATSSTGGASSYADITRESERQAYRNTGNATSNGSGSSYHRGKNKADSSDN